MKQRRDLTFGEWLKDAREKRGYSMRKLADLSGISNSSISQWEKVLKPGERAKIPKPETIRKVHGHLRVSYDEMMERAGHVKLQDLRGDRSDTNFLDALNRDGIFDEDEKEIVEKMYAKAFKRKHGGIPSGFG